ncbi:MAG: 30S ribosome-binding factor RbfA [Candidatus Eremiobacteraeota bacterium]|nr:30S ribosome-binding factor RbfA [Candidatus Eremiobacteraeota bacterium]
MAKRHRRERVEDLLLEVVSEVFRKVKDPGIPSEGLVSFMKVEVANDLGYADVKYSYLGDDKNLEDLQAALDRSKGFFRREINRVVRLRKIPELRFQLDRSMEKGSEILTLLEKVRTDDAKRGGTGTDGPEPGPG